MLKEMLPSYPRYNIIQSVVVEDIFLALVEEGFQHWKQETMCRYKTIKEFAVKDVVEEGVCRLHTWSIQIPSPARKTTIIQNSTRSSPPKTGYSCSEGQT
jgi:hypothetical protein